MKFLKKYAFAMFAVSVAVAVLTGCASNFYQAQFDELKTAYQTGKISASEYQAQWIDLERLELQKREAVSRALQGAANQFNSYHQQQQSQQSQDQQPTGYIIRSNGTKVPVYPGQIIPSEEKRYEVIDDEGNSRTYKVRPR